MNKLGFYAEQSAHIAHANQAFEETIANGVITHPEVRDLAMNLITTEQDAAIAAMNTQYELDVDEAERIPEEDVKRIGEIATIIAEYEAADEQKKRQLGILATFYAQAKDIALSNHESAIDALREEEARLSAKREIPFEGNEHLYAAWNIPVRDVVDAEPFKFPEYFDWQQPETHEEHELPEEEGAEYIFPDDLPLSDEQIRERVQRRYNGRCEDASTYLAYLAAEELGRIWTQKALGDQIYYGEDIDQNTKNGRVSALLSNFHYGHGPIADALKELNPNYRMQTGRRYPIVDEKRYGKGCRVCRVIDMTKGPLPDTDEGHEIVWEKIRTRKVKPIEEQSDAPAQVPVSPVNVLEKMQENPEVTDPTAAELFEEVSTEDEPDAPDTNETELNKMEALLADASVWLEPIISALGNELPLLRIARHDNNSPYFSRVVGTKTNLQRAEAAQIISHKESESGIIAEPHKAIATAILNKHRDIFRNRATRIEALLALEKLVADYIASQKRASKRSRKF